MEQIVKVDSKIQIEITKDVLAPEWDKFLTQIPDGSHYQTSMWGHARIFFGWQPVRVIVKNNDRVIAGGQILHRAYRPFGRLAILPKGPLVDPDHIEILEPLSKAIMNACRAEGIQYLAVRPPDNGQLIAKYLPHCGITRSPFNIFKAASIKIDLTPDLETIFSNMRRNLRQNIRRCTKDGITLQTGTEADLPAFYSIYTASGQRQGFTPEPFDYFKTLWQEFSPNNNIVIILAFWGNELVSGAINIAFGDSVIGKYLGWSGLHNECHPNDAVWWESIKWAKLHGYHYFDFDGIGLNVAKSILAGPPYTEILTKDYSFKKFLYGGQVTLFPDAFDCMINPVARMGYQITKPLLMSQSKTIESIWSKIKNR